MDKCRVLYDFNAESASELSVTVGNELTVLDSSSYEGWLYVRNESTKAEGIVPLSYVEYIASSSSANDDIPPPPSHNPYSQESSWGAPAAAAVTTPKTNYPDSYVNSSFSPSLAMPQPQSYSSNYNNAATSWDQPVKPPARPPMNDSDDSDFEETSPTQAANAGSQRNASLNTSSMNISSGSGTMSRHKQRNTYGIESFLLYGAAKSVPETEKQSVIIMNEQGLAQWKRQPTHYQCQIVNTSCDKKYHGVKKFISYEIVTKAFNARVKRRYNHFDWLIKRLEEKYPNICILPLPDKAAVGNFEEEFIAKRRAMLECWLNRMCAHPVISQSEVFVHFLQSDENSAKWKQGKRKAERDEYRGAQWFCTLTVPGVSLDTTVNLKERLDKFSKSAVQLESNVKNLSGALERLSSAHSNTYKKDMQSLGKRLEEFGATLNSDQFDAPNNQKVAAAFHTAGNSFSQIANMYGEQAKTDINPLLERLLEYKGMLQQFPDIVAFNKNAIQTVEEFQARPEKLEGRNIGDVSQRLDMINYVTQAEINLFNKDKVDDFATYMRTFLTHQINFYSEITDILKRSLSAFEAPGTMSTPPGQQQIRR